MKRVIIRRRVKAGTGRTPATGAQGTRIKLVDNETLNKFNSSILGLGDIGVPSREIEAIAAVFDLSGFTRFCTQADPHLAVPKYLSSFLDWLFDKVRTGLTQEEYGDRKALWTELPFLAKFLGDGVLLLWNTRGMTETLICKIVTTLHEICYAYKHQFYPKISMAVDKPPTILRCGMARGRVFSVGNGKDYVGHCINTAARLQKLSLLTFCFPQRGFAIQEYMPENSRRIFAQKCVTIRGIGENELIWLVKDEFDRLPERSKELFRTP